jgi:hypothetical protein
MFVRRYKSGIAVGSHMVIIITVRVARDDTRDENYGTP